MNDLLRPVGAIAPPPKPTSRSSPQSLLRTPDRSSSVFPVEIWMNVARRLACPDLRSLILAAPAMARNLDFAALFQRRTDPAMVAPGLWQVERALRQDQALRDAFATKTWGPILGACLLLPIVVNRSTAQSPEWPLHLVFGLSCAAALASIPTPCLQAKLRLLRLSRAMFLATMTGLYTGLIFAACSRPAERKRSEGAAYVQEVPATALRRLALLACCCMRFSVFLSHLSARQVDSFLQAEQMPLAGMTHQRLQALGRVFSGWRDQILAPRTWARCRLEELEDLVSMGRDALFAQVAKRGFSSLSKEAEQDPAGDLALMTFLRDKNRTLHPAMTLVALSQAKFSEDAQKRGDELIDVVELWSFTSDPAELARMLIADEARKLPTYLAVHGAFRSHLLEADGQNEPLMKVGKALPAVGEYLQGMMEASAKVVVRPKMGLRA